MARPSLDKIGNWLEGRFTSFIAGEGDSPKPVDTNGKVPTFSGPFAHYSTISTATSSNIPSPQMSSSNLAGTQPVMPPFRTGSAGALQPPSASHAQIARASSAIDYLRRKPSPVPRVSSANATTRTSFVYGYANGSDAPRDNTDLATPTTQYDVSKELAGPQLGSWWGSGDSGAPTPTATSFSHSNAPLNSSSNGFLSLMDDSAVVGPSSSTSTHFQGTATMNSTKQDDLDDEDDLGLGNSSNRAKKPVSAPAEEGTKPAATAAAPRVEQPSQSERPATASGGWLSRLWKRSETGPVKANLGDDSAFYYDAEQKRWVNKNASSESAKPSTTPPPPRAQTASPGMSAARAPPSPGPPPARPATAIDLTDGPVKKPPMRVRSNLVPSEATSAPSTPSSPAPPRTPSTMVDGPPGLDGPPTARTRAPIKRNARSRYVDVFQQEPSN